MRNKGSIVMRLCASIAALSMLSALGAAPARAHEAHGHAAPPPAPYGAPYGVWQQPGMALPQGPEREAWLKDCRKRLSDNGLGGAVIGGLLGGVAGNVIAGQGNRAVGTVAGAAVGAVAGAAIDKAEDRGPVADRCEAMLAGGPAMGMPGYIPAGYMPYGYMLVPVMVLAAAQAAPRECKETVVTEEYVTMPTRRSRHIPRRAPDKRVRLVPDKRVPQ